MKNKKFLLVSASLVLLLILYLLIYSYFPNKVFKCVFYEISGFKCPGCGITRLLHNFINFRFVVGIKNNYFVGVTFPLIVYGFIYTVYVCCFDKNVSKRFNVCCVIYLVMLIFWGIIRNIIGV